MFATIEARIDAFRVSDAAVLDPGLRWHSTSIISFLRDVGRQAYGLPPPIQVELNAANMKKAIELMLRGDAEVRRERVEVVLRRRAGEWTESPGENVQQLRRIATTFLPSELVMTVWRFFFNAWCTMSQYAQEIMLRRFCEAPGTDRLTHSAACLEARRWFARFGFGAQPSDGEMPRWRVAGCVAIPALAVKMVSALDALTSSYDARRHGGRSGAKYLCVARLNEIGCRYAVVRTVARDLLPP